MALTLDFIREQFNLINERHFNGELKRPRFEITHVKYYLGQYHWRYACDNVRLIESVIRISDMYDRSDADIANTLAHEMIHLYIRQNRIKDTRPHHGLVFNTIADRLNREGGFHIARTDSVAGCGLRDKSEVKTYYVINFKTNEGKYFQFVVNKNYLSSYIDRIERCPYYYKDAYIFTSKNDKRFAHYRVCRNRINGFYISKEVFDTDRANEKLIKNFTTLGIKHDAA